MSLGPAAVARPFFAASVILGLLVVAYLYQLNRLLSSTPAELLRLTPSRWTEQLLRDTYARLESQRFSTKSYADQIPKRLDRRYIVTGGSGKMTLATHIHIHIRTHACTHTHTRMHTHAHTLTRIHTHARLDPLGRYGMECALTGQVQASWAGTLSSSSLSAASHLPVSAL